MAAGALSSTRNPHDVRFKRLLLGACAFGIVWVALSGYAWFGLGGRPWTGFFDADSGASAPFVIEFGRPEPGGAAARAGIREGDRADIREQPWAERMVVLYQPSAQRPTILVLHRGSKTIVARVVGSTIFEGGTIWKILNVLPPLLVSFWILAFAVLIAVRQSSLLEARIVVPIYICFAISNVVLIPPNPTLALLSHAFAQNAASCIAFSLLVALASQFGTRPKWRRLLELVAYCLIAMKFLWHGLFYVGIVTLKFDPFPYYGAMWLDYCGTLLVAVVAIVAMALTQPQRRPRAGWLLLPIPLTHIAMLWGIPIIVTASLGIGFQSVADTWVFAMVINAVYSAISVTGALLVTHAMLNRRVLDFGYVLGRTIVLASLVLLVVAAFLAIEWLLLKAFSRLNPGANIYVVGLATLVLGVSMPRIYNWLSQGVERYVFFGEHRAREKVQELAASLPYAQTAAAIAATVTDGVCAALDLASAAVFQRESGDAYVRIAAFGWTDDEQLDPIDTQRLAMNLHVSRTAFRLAGHMANSHLPPGNREPVVAFPLFARRELTGYILYSAGANGVELDPDDLKLLASVAQEASRGFDAVALAARVENAYEAKVAAQAEAVETIKRSHAALERINEAQARFMPSEFLRYLGRENIVDVNLGDSVEKVMTILFSDIRSFTALSEGMSPQQIFTYLNRYLRRAGPIIGEHGGFIDKYIGDAIMGLFPKSAGDALDAGIDLQREIRVFNRKLSDEDLPPLSIGVGLHTGDLILGTIGERNRMDTTVIADAVNAAARLEGATKDFACSIVLSRATKEALPDANRYMLRRLGSLRVRGKTASLDAYEAFDADPPDLIAHKHDTLARFDEALASFEAGELANARAGFEEIVSANTQDGPAAFYLERCAEPVPT